MLTPKYHARAMSHPGHVLHCCVQRTVIAVAQATYGVATQTSVQCVAFCSAPSLIAKWVSDAVAIRVIVGCTCASARSVYQRHIAGRRSKQHRSEQRRISFSSRALQREIAMRLRTP